MAITLNQLIERMEKAVSELDTTREANALINSSDALALVKQRIQRRRVDANGAKLGQYSTAKVPFWFFRNKPTLGNPDGKVKELYKRFGYFASYRDWKIVNNQTNPDINLTFTGRMMNSMRVVIAGRQRNSVLVTWAAGNDKEQQKFEYALDRFPEAFRLDDKERQFIEEGNNRRLQKIIDKIFN